MTHDDLVIWAYENASDLIKMAGFAPRAIDLTDEATRSNPDTRYKRIIEEQGFPFIVPTVGQQSLGF